MTRGIEPPVARRTPKRWTKPEYITAVERGGFDSKRFRLYLYRGELIEEPPMGTLHARCLTRLNVWLHHAFRPQMEVCVRLPFELADDSIPEPDGAVLTAEQAARRPYPNAGLLLIEVADGSLEVDREMADDYAAADMPEYWIANVRDRQIEVYRNPVPDAASPIGHRYADRRVYGMGESVAPLAKPNAMVAVAALVDVA